jgi:hypothetical protein
VDTSRVAGLWCQVGEPGELISAGEGGHVTAGGSEEFCTQPGTDAGQAGVYLGVPMFAKSGLNKLIQLCDFVIKGDHPLASRATIWAAKRSPGNTTDWVRAASTAVWASAAALCTRCLRSHDSRRATPALRIAAGVW